MTVTETTTFETPENITVSYKIAGLGTRYVAWVFDMLLLLLGYVLIVVALLAAGWFSLSFGIGLEPPSFLGAVFIVALGFLPLLYFGLSELLMSGQTFGKRSVHIRVVMTEGFSLTFSAVLIRTLFRLIDSIPLLWAVPLCTNKSQRFGDMVAGTVVITEETPDFGVIQERLLNRRSTSVAFGFTAAQLNSLSEEDFEAIAKILQRQSRMSPVQFATLAKRSAAALAQRMSYAPYPHEDERLRFLEDLLTAHLQRQTRQLG